MLKLAISADGKVATAGRRPIAITGGRVRDRVHLLRAQSDAIMIGIGTALADDPILTCRLPGMAKLSPVRVVLDSGLRLPIGSRLVQTASDTPLWVICKEYAPPANEPALRAQDVEVIRIGERDGLAVVLSLLGSRGVTRLMVEGGPVLAAALIAAGLVDEAVLFHSNLVIGDDGVSAFEPQTLATLNQHLVRVASEQVGSDRQDHYERG
jgi:diaminohydroxyphosphoribosylaminopyrimidine deaminase/5-amino-6-(5-phosphoribosylamino)uracil reductase